MIKMSNLRKKVNNTLKIENDLLRKSKLKKLIYTIEAKEMSVLNSDNYKTYAEKEATLAKLEQMKKRVKNCLGIF